MLLCCQKGAVERLTSLLQSEARNVHRVWAAVQLVLFPPCCFMPDRLGGLVFAFLPSGNKIKSLYYSILLKDLQGV